MSLPASKRALESPQNNSVNGYNNEHKLLQSLVAADVPPQEPVIAIDLDDVLCQTNQKVAEWHNHEYGTEMDLSTFYYYYYWKNPFWGTPKETMIKVAKFYSTDWIHTTQLVPGAKEGLQALKDMGYRLIIVTARDKLVAVKSRVWVEKYFPGLIDSLICTGQFTRGEKEGHEIATKLSKAQVCADIKARLLIDDSAENALQCATSSAAVPVLLFGNYEWNKRLSNSHDTREEMTFDIRLAAEGGRRFWEHEGLEIPEGAPLWRVREWTDVVRWVREELNIEKPMT
ncbi:hypothetical protein JOM56_006338 [Amanita muscaria]